MNKGLRQAGSAMILAGLLTAVSSHAGLGKDPGDKGGGKQAASGGMVFVMSEDGPPVLSFTGQAKQRTRGAKTAGSVGNDDLLNIKRDVMLAQQANGAAKALGVVKQAQFSPNTAAAPKIALPPRAGEKKASSSRKTEPVFQPVRKKAKRQAPPSLQQASLTPNVGRSPKAAALRSAPAPDNKLVELVETPSDQALSLGAGRGQMLSLGAPVSDIFVADNTIADVRVVSPTKMFVYGNQLGRTNIFGIGADGDVIFAIDLDVVPDAEIASRELKALAPNGGADIQLVSDRLVAEGVVGDVGEAVQVAAFSEQLAATQGPTWNNTLIGGSQQVNLRVRFAEVSRTDVFNLGINWEALSNTGDFLFGLSTGPDIGDIGNLVGGQGLFGAAEFGDVNVEAFIDALQQEGLINLLAEPNLTAINGESATFLAGGEIPIPVPGGAGGETVVIDYKPFGVSLDFLPTLLPGDRINLRIRPEVSSLNGNGGIVIQGFEIPAFTVRRAETSVELASGQTFAIAGLFQRDVTIDTDKFPLLGDVPILGKLFQSERYRRAETELVILITPYLVKPTSNPNVALATDRANPFDKPLTQQTGKRRAGFFLN